MGVGGIAGRLHKSALFAVISLSLGWPAPAVPHGGGLDAKGGHYNRKTSVYHCHRCPCGCPDETNNSIQPGTPMRDRPKSPGGGSPGAAPTQKAPDRSVSLSSSSNEPRTSIVVEAIDGDTLRLEGGEKVRLIGVDTPETKHPTKPVEYFGREASAFTKRLAEGRTVRLEFDQDTKDKYGRTLAYVYLADGTFLNAEIIRQGYGHAYTRFPFKYMEEFRKHEREARENSRGLWKRR